jgi:hypothetical protein
MVGPEKIRDGFGPERTGVRQVDVSCTQISIAPPSGGCSVRAAARLDGVGVTPRFAPGAGAPRPGPAAAARLKKGIAIQGTQRTDDATNANKVEKLVEKSSEK